MIASVFLMQPVGQALAQVIGLLVLLGRNREYDLKGLQCGISTTHEEECKKIVDGIWRIVIGIGAVPALLAIVFRFFLYDCGLYSLEVKNKPGTALGNTRRIYGPVPHPNELAASNENVNGAAFQASNGFGEGRPISPQPMPIQFSLVDLYNYFIRDGNWYYLLGRFVIGRLAAGCPRSPWRRLQGLAM